MKCYFNIVGGAEEIIDEVGVEVGSVDEARAEALKAIDELRRQDRSILGEWIGLELHIVDEDGRVVSTIPLRPPYRYSIKLRGVDDVCDPNAKWRRLKAEQHRYHMVFD